MSLYDKKYLNIVEDILNNGYYDNNRTGMPTYKLPHQVMQFNLEKEFPILTTKFVAFKTAVKGKVRRACGINQCADVDRRTCLVFVRYERYGRST